NNPKSFFILKANFFEKDYSWVIHRKL
ncbi:MAG: hypothetical protein JWR54_1891, partial [Mucilaginibacter sp.]|nr:hypothetical protein [Mucilaginibacter sp.]